MKTLYKRILAAGVVFFYLLVVAWIVGFNFDERNALVAYYFVVATVISAMAFWFPFS